jgi:hypothetical protein
MRKLLLLAMVCVGLFSLIAGSAWADTLNLTALPSGAAGGYYVGFTSGNVNGVSNPISGFVCNDFTTNTYIPTSYQVNVSSLYDLTYAKFRTGDGIEANYQRAAVLVNDMILNPTNIPIDQYAIWYIFDPTDTKLTSNSFFTSNQTAIVAASAVAVPTDFDFSTFRVFTAIPNTSNQEFLAFFQPGTDIPGVPIPGSSLLLAPGLAGLVALRRRIKK